MISGGLQLAGKHTSRTGGSAAATGNGLTLLHPAMNLVLKAEEQESHEIAAVFAAAPGSNGSRSPAAAVRQLATGC